MRAILSLIVCVLVLAACQSQEPAAPTSTLVPTSPPTPLVNTLVTNTPRPTLATTSTPELSPTTAPSLPPLTQVAQRPDQPLPTLTPPCEDAPRPRIIVGERGRVTMEDMRPLNVRAGPGTDMRIVGRLEVGDIFRVLDGPRCGNSFVWFLVERADRGLRGWVAEGEFSFYYIAPFLPG